MLFANRRLSAETESKIRRRISQTAKIPEGSILLCDIKQIELWLKRFPDAARIADIDPVDSPLITSPDELAEVVEGLAKHLSDATATALSTHPTERVLYERKNSLNNMTAEYARELRKRYLKETQQIKIFLAAPENSSIQEKYDAVTEEFQLKILAKRKDYQTFDEVMCYLMDLLFDRDPVLRRHKRLTRTIIFYMYWNCDIGLSEHAATK